MPDLSDVAGELASSIAARIEAAVGRPGIFRRFVSRRDTPAPVSDRNGHSSEESSQRA
jgi:hypothetical protein